MEKILGGWLYCMHTSNTVIVEGAGGARWACCRKDKRTLGHKSRTASLERSCSAVQREEKSQVLRTNETVNKSERNRAGPVARRSGGTVVHTRAP